MNGLLDFLQGASNAAASNVTAPVDLINWLLQKAGLPVSQAPVGGSAWAEQKGLTKKPQNALLGMAGETAGLLSPVVAAAKAPQIAKGLLQAGDNLAAAPNVNRGLSGGQRGIFGGELAKTADKAALSKAKELEKAGTDPRAIWSETGWFKGGDGKWRFEIDDSGAKWERSFSESPPGVAINTAVGDALDHSELFKAYPRSSNTLLGMYPSAHNASYQPAADKIVITHRGDYGRSDLLHELQHAVQQREGFSRGGSPAEFPPQFAGALRDLERGLRSGVSAFSVRNPATGAITKVTREQAAHQLSSYGGKAGSPDDLYMRLAGEAEARAVQSRMSLTPAQRRQMFPLDSFDVPVNELIYR